jgi:hypothetical protein
LTPVSLLELRRGIITLSRVIPAFPQVVMSP